MSEMRDHRGEADVVGFFPVSFFVLRGHHSVNAIIHHTAKEIQYP
jgi:hypothetical protein